MCLATAPGHFRLVDDRSVPVVTDVPPGDEHVPAAAELCPMAAVPVRASETGGRVAPADCPAVTSRVTAIPGNSGPSTVPRAGGPRSGHAHCGRNGFRSRNASGGSSGTATDRYGEERQTAALIPRSGSFRTPAVDGGRHTRDVTTRRGPAGPRRGFGPGAVAAGLRRDPVRQDAQARGGTAGQPERHVRAGLDREAAEVVDLHGVRRPVGRPQP
ncbi:MAG TPA: hypothetical protein VGO94_09830, partial [Mycobacteriales bacterium]|nr:hypothetical protein [Mycobacteriales bacterium]